jgi:hypothetical protein
MDVVEELQAAESLFALSSPTHHVPTSCALRLSGMESPLFLRAMIVEEGVILRESSLSGSGCHFAPAAENFEALQV